MLTLSIYAPCKYVTIPGSHTTGRHCQSWDEEYCFGPILFGTICDVLTLYVYNRCQSTDVISYEFRCRSAYI